MRNLLKQVAQPQANATTFIYGLADPTTDYIRYIGKSDTPKSRLVAHLTKQSLAERSHKVHWLRTLVEKNLRPKLVIIEEVSALDWEIAEKKWIAHYRNIPGYPKLTNTCSGGEGVDKGTKHSEETIRKMVAAHLGRPMPPGTGKKISDSLRGTTKTWKARIHYSLSQVRRWKNSSDEEKQNMLSNLRTEWSDEKRLHRSNCAMNAPKKNSATSRYRGVMKVNRPTPWIAQCTLNKKYKYIGAFPTEEQAARARDRFVIAHIGERAPLNFPRSDYA